MSKKVQCKDIVDLKVSNCDKYIIGIESCCYRHDILMGKFLRRSVCNDCVNESVVKDKSVLYCNSCYEEIYEYQQDAFCWNRFNDFCDKNSATHLRRGNIVYMSSIFHSKYEKN